MGVVLLHDLVRMEMGKGKWVGWQDKVPVSNVKEQFETIQKGPGAAALPCSKKKASVHQD